MTEGTAVRVLVVMPERAVDAGYVRAGAFDRLGDRYHLVAAVVGRPAVAPPPGFAETRYVAPEPPSRARRRAWVRDVTLLRGRSDSAHYRDAFGRAAARNLAGVPAWRRALVRGAAWLARVNPRRAVPAERRLGVATALREVVETVAPRLILVLFDAYDSVTIDAIDEAHRAKVPVIALQSAWPVFTDEPPLPSRPTCVGVWGWQSAFWAEALHGIPKSRLFFLGGPFPAVPPAGDTADGVVLVDVDQDHALAHELAATGTVRRILRGGGAPSRAEVSWTDGLRGAAVSVTRSATLALQSVASGVPTVLIVREPAGPTESFLDAVPGCFTCHAPQSSAGAVRRALAFRAAPERVRMMMAHARTAAYADRLPLADRLADAVSAVLDGPLGSRYHYLVDPLIDVEAGDNVVDAIVGDGGGGAYAYFDRDMIDSEELGSR